MWEDGVMQNGDIEVFRARGNIAIAIFIELFLASNIWASCYQGAKNVMTSIFVAIALSAATYATFIKPRVIFSNEGMEIFNPFAHHFIRWDEVEDIDARWCMTITTSDRTINAYGAPAPGRHRVLNIYGHDLRGMSAGETGWLRPARSPRSDSGVAVHIALMWQARAANSHTARSSDHSSNFTSLGVGVATAVVALLINLL